MSEKDRHQQIKEIFSEALELAESARRQYLDQICGTDKPLRGEIESLLASFEKSAEFIENPAFSVNQILAPQSAPPLYFGNYKIIREIGHGGMGTVYLAERCDGQFEQQVAIKIVRQTFADSEIIRRFKNERQILAKLQHPNIAGLLDGGISESGQPFLAMEYVEGEIITDFCRNLSVNERLILFLKVCKGTAYAHRNLIVHRDIKPSNILVNHENEAKLLDFGLAKLAVADSENTQTHFRALTPAYASPEQLKGETITTASDIYSLGVVLYEILTETRPFETDGKSFEEIFRTVTIIEPDLPSKNLKSKARNLKLLRGDLDNITLMALRKEPTRRYESVAQFAKDIENYLNGLPVIARPNTVSYRAEKFLKRNKIAVFAAFFVWLSLLTGIVLAVWQAREARAQAYAAQAEKAKAESISAFLQKMLKYSNPLLAQPGKNGGETSMKDALDEAARRIESDEFDNQPEVKAELEKIIGESYSGQGRNDLWQKHLTEYAAIETRLYGENSPKSLEANAFRAAGFFLTQDFAEAEQIFRRILPQMREEQRRGNIRAESLAQSLNVFGYLRRTQGDSKEAEMLFRESIALSPQIPDEWRYLVGVTRSTLASTLADQGRFNEALETARQAVEEYRLNKQTGSPDYGFALTVFGGFLAEKEDYAAADAVLGEAETLFRQRLSPSHLWLGDCLRNQAISFYEQGKYSDSQIKINEAQKIYLESFGKNYDHYPTVLMIEGLILTKTGNAAAGEKLLREAVGLRTATLPPEHFWVAIATSALGECLLLQKRFAEAAPLLSGSYESLNNSQGADNPRTIAAHKRLLALEEKRR